ncbi:MAG: membrane protein insertase YidC [Acidobacteria bacterium]|nr:membrane protein insertase YidC [Acidobacteriota bacterium]
MERNLLLAFLLLAVVIFGSQLFMRKYAPQQPPSSAHPTQPIQPGNPSTSTPPPEHTAALARTPSVVPAPTGSRQAASESEIVVENDLYRISFTNRGAQAKSWVLKKFSDDQGRPLDLVNPAAARYGYPLSLWTYDQTARDKLNSALYVPGTNARWLGSPAALTFEYSDSGLMVRKSFSFDHSYVVSVDTVATSPSGPLYAYPAWPAGFGDQTTPQAYASGQFEYQLNNSTEHLGVKKVSGQNTLHGSYDWVGVSSSFFGAVFIPENPDDLYVVSLHNVVDIIPDPSRPNEIKPGDVLGVAAGRPGESRGRLFVGPKSLEVLEAVRVPAIAGAEKDLRAVVNFGSLGLIARPLFLWLRWTNKYIHNWGWSIVLQTLIITIALLPLRITQMRSQLKMQRVQPQMKVIQEKYKKYSMRDPRKQEMQKEIAELYKREGVNPVSGCLPLVVQLPFLWAYYKMLGAAIDLRQAHWLWIHDLSSRDPYFLLPLIMVASMFVMQKMNPQTGMDPAQQRMMNFMMPAMMGFIFFNLAAGLNLYYAESNLIMIAQQAIMNRTELGREMKEIAAKRARKKKD